MDQQCPACRSISSSDPPVALRWRGPGTLILRSIRKGGIQCPQIWGIPLGITSGRRCAPDEDNAHLELILPGPGCMVEHLEGFLRSSRSMWHPETCRIAYAPHSVVLFLEDPTDSYSTSLPFQPLWLRSLLALLRKDASTNRTFKETVTGFRYAANIRNWPLRSWNLPRRCDE